MVQKTMETRLMSCKGRVSTVEPAITLIKPESIAAFFFAPLGAMCQNGFGTIFGGEPDGEDDVFETTFFG